MTNNTALTYNDPLNNYLKVVDIDIERVKVSKMNQHNVVEIQSYSHLGVKNKQLVADNASSYNVIATKLTTSLKIHMNVMTEQYNKGALVYNTSIEGEKGALLFQKPSIYLIHIGDEVTSKMITPSDDLLAYEFLLFRTVSGVDAYNMMPKFVVSFDPGSTEMYKNSDVLQSYKYKINNIEEQAYHGNKINPNALSMFKQEKTEITGIVKSVLSSFVYHCVKLKNSDKEIEEEICRKSYDPGDPDYALNMFTCHEIFQIIKIAGMCDPVTYEEPDL